MSEQIDRSSTGHGTFCQIKFCQLNFFQIFPNSFGCENLSIGLFCRPAQLIKSYKSCPLAALKRSIFHAFRS